ncbi:MAG: histidinol-phosphate transaminase [Rhodospirillaceae bacterium]|jgi:histidinol-phosphate aminotransferase|nr:histidinol-phosphate transaminase [Rhodospirillaceae bacterium]
MNTPRVQPGIMEIAPYVGGASAVDGAKRTIKLSSNESALGPSRLASAAYGNLAEQLHRYPDGDCTELRQAIAKTFSLDAAGIVCGAGSDEIISLLCQAYAGPGDEVLYSEHGFLMYPISAKAVGATPVTAPETELTTDVDALLGAVTDKTRILFVANPNNPTGTYIPASELQRLRNGLRDDVLLVIDAAYAEYVSREDYGDGAALVEAHDNVVMTRTFSKIYGLGGMRLGWGYMSTNIAEVLHRVRGPFNVSAAAQAAGTAAVRDKTFTANVRAHNDKWLPWTRGKLIGLGLRVTDSVGNFLLVCFQNRPDHGAEAADAFLRGEGIIVRRMAGYGLPDCLRITIGTRGEMESVVECMSRFLGRNS